MNKTENLMHLREEWAHLETTLSGLTREQMLQPRTCGEWSVKDALAHITHWEQHMLGDWQRLRAGEACREIQDVEIDAINAGVYEANRERSLEDVLVGFRASHSQVVTWLEAATAEELAQPYLYGMTVGAFVKIDTWAHYSEHAAQIEALGRAA